MVSQTNVSNIFISDEKKKQLFSHYRYTWQYTHTHTYTYLCIIIFGHCDFGSHTHTHTLCVDGPKDPDKSVLINFTLAYILEPRTQWFRSGQTTCEGNDESSSMFCARISCMTRICLYCNTVYIKYNHDNIGVCVCAPT